MGGSGYLTIPQMCRTLAMPRSVYQPMPQPPSLLGPMSSAPLPIRPTSQRSPATFDRDRLPEPQTRRPRTTHTLRCSFLMTCLSSSFQKASSSSFCFRASAAALASALRARAAADLVFSPWNFLGIPQQAVGGGRRPVSGGVPPWHPETHTWAARTPLRFQWPHL